MTNERNDDEVLGRALARAIETQEPNETPYERSRAAVRQLRGGFPFAQFAGAAGVILVIALAFGSWLTRPITSAPVAAPASATALATATANATASASATATSGPQVEVPGTVVGPGPDSLWVYFTRDSLPPVGGYVHGRLTVDSAVGRISIRLGSLQGTHDAVPTGASNPLSLVAPVQNGGSSFGVFPRVQGDVATVEFQIPTGWGVHGSAQTQALVQQLVYVITEEPGIRYARIVESGKQTATIDGLLIDKPLSREDVFGYTSVGPLGMSNAISEGGPALSISDRNNGYTGFSTSSKGTSYRVAIDAIGTETRGSGSQTDRVAAFSVWMAEAEGDLKQMGKYVLTVIVGATTAPGAPTFVRETGVSDQTPVRGWITRGLPGVAVWQIILDDARPWRVYKQPADGRLVVEIGGDPRLVSDRIAASEPVFDAKVGQSFVLSGSARVFEANVVWRVKDSAQTIVASGHTTASIGTSALWGTFQTTIALPASVTTGKLTLEVYEASPKDGSEQGLVAITLNR